jgi:hypothetical protein
MRDEKRETNDASRTTCKEAGLSEDAAVVGVGGKSQGGVFLARLVRIDYIGHI